MSNTALLESPSSVESISPFAAVNFPSLGGLGAEQAVARLAGFAIASKCSDLFLASEADHIAVSVRQLGIVPN